MCAGQVEDRKVRIHSHARTRANTHTHTHTRAHTCTHDRQALLARACMQGRWNTAKQLLEQLHTASLGLMLERQMRHTAESPPLQLRNSWTRATPRVNTGSSESLHEEGGEGRGGAAKSHACSADHEGVTRLVHLIQGQCSTHLK